MILLGDVWIKIYFLPLFSGIFVLFFFLLYQKHTKILKGQGKPNFTNMFHIHISKPMFSNVCIKIWNYFQYCRIAFRFLVNWTFDFIFTRNICMASSWLSFIITSGTLLKLIHSTIILLIFETFSLFRFSVH